MGGIEGNKKVAREYIQQVFNEHRSERLIEFVTPDVVWHGGVLGTVVGAEKLGILLYGFLSALPDLHAAEQDVVAEGDLVMVRLKVTATHQGDLLGMPARGKQIRWDAIETYRIRDGWISEEWAANDMAAICHQLGAFDPPWLN